MAKKINTLKKWWSKTKKKPITWGDYAKYCKWTFGLAAVAYVVAIIVYVVRRCVENHKFKKVKVEEA